MLGIEINALAYYECSAKEAIGVDALFDGTADVLHRRRRGLYIPGLYLEPELGDKSGDSVHGNNVAAAGSNGNEGKKKKFERFRKLSCFS